MAYAVGTGIEQSRLLLNRDVKGTDDTLKSAHLNQVIGDVRSYIQREEPLRLRGDRLIASLTTFIQSLRGVQELNFTAEMDSIAAGNSRMNNLSMGTIWHMRPSGILFATPMREAADCHCNDVADPSVSQ